MIRAQTPESMHTIAHMHTCITPSRSPTLLNKYYGSFMKQLYEQSHLGKCKYKICVHTFIVLALV